MEEEKLTIKGAAEYYGRSESWIRKKILNGQLDAEKENFKYGKRWVTTEKSLDDLEKKLQEQAKAENEIVNVREVNKPVDKETLINDLIDATESRNKELIDDAVDNINKNINKQNKQMQEQISKLTKKVEQLQQEKEKSFIDKLKDLFK